MGSQSNADTPEYMRMMANGCYRLFGSIFLAIAVMLASAALIRVLLGSQVEIDEEAVVVEPEVQTEADAVDLDDPILQNSKTFLASADIESKASAYNAEIDRLRDMGAFSAHIAQDIKKTNKIFDRKYDAYDDSLVNGMSVPYFNRGVTLS